MVTMLEGNEFYFGKVLGKLFSLIGVDSTSCATGEDGIMGALALVINAIFILVSLGLFAKIAIDIFGSGKKRGGMPGGGGEDGGDMSPTPGNNDSDMENHIQRWKDNFKKNIIPLIGVSIFVIMGVVLKSNGCSEG